MEIEEWDGLTPLGDDVADVVLLPGHRRWMNRRITTEESEERPGMTVLDVSKAACAGCDTPAMKAAFPCAFTDGTGPSLSRNA